MNTIFFDIETGPLPDQELNQMVPPFDPTEVKVGNLKDPEKITAKRAEAEANHRREFVERAALDPLTGRVLAIGLLSEKDREFRVLGNEDEATMLLEFWAECRGEGGKANCMIGFNTRAFDLPFLIRRSFKHRVGIPFGIRRGRYWCDEMVDLREEWQLGDRQARGSLDTVARYLGVGQKNGHGDEFARLWKEDRERAVAYLRTDLELTAGIAEALGLATPAYRPRNSVNVYHPPVKREQRAAVESYSIVTI
jgi:3'-5' exonuclease